MISPKFHYSGVSFDRAAALRKDTKWVKSKLILPGSLFIPLWRGKNLISGIKRQTSLNAVYLPREKFSEIKKFVSEIVFLGLDAGKAIFACDISQINENDLKTFTEDSEFADLRHVGQLLSAEEASRLAYARGILHWHKNYLFCSKCGSKSTSKNGGHMRLCSNKMCQKETFPRTDPAVIMLVEHRSAEGVRRCLLGQHAKSPKETFSTLAGFVDPGETLEEAVRREVFEEAGIVVGDVLYQGSQPWPFPASIMLGFRAQAKSEEINVDPDELTEARWFTAKELETAGEWGDKNPGLKISRKDSIARYLIDSWISEQS